MSKIKPRVTPVYSKVSQNLMSLFTIYYEYQSQVHAEEMLSKDRDYGHDLLPPTPVQKRHVL